ncbi:hypothetical protein CHUV2995_03139 [Corynebacterium diphtheriae subsp. lausannense]|nr:hypothetical protein CHUV2995_03139 [Corynebacterium diphtheriae subsp. lausannense]
MRLVVPIPKVVMVATSASLYELGNANQSFSRYVMDAVHVVISGEWLQRGASAVAQAPPMRWKLTSGRQMGGCSYLVVNSLGSLVGGKERAVSPLIELFSGMPMSRLGITQSALDLCGYAAAAPVSAVVSR